MLWQVHEHHIAKSDFPQFPDVAGQSPPKSDHAHNPSLQSVSSAITDMSQESADSNFSASQYNPEAIVPKKSKA